MNIADILLVSIVGIFTLLGIKSGLIKTAIRIGSIFLSIFISFIAYPLFSNMFFSDEVIESVSESINAEYVSPYMNNIISENLGSGAGLLGMALKDAESRTANASKALSDKITKTLVNGLTFLIIMILCKVIFAVLAGIFIKAARLPIIKQVNMAAGGVVGFLQGVLICFLLISAVAFIAPMNKSVAAFDEQIQNSGIASQIYKNNFIINTISSKII